MVLNSHLEMTDVGVKESAEMRGHIIGRRKDIL